MIGDIEFSATGVEARLRLMAMTLRGRVQFGAQGVRVCFDDFERARLFRQLAFEAFDVRAEVVRIDGGFEAFIARSE